MPSTRRMTVATRGPREVVDVQQTRGETIVAWVDRLVSTRIDLPFRRRRPPNGLLGRSACFFRRHPSGSESPVIVWLNPGFLCGGEGSLPLLSSIRRRTAPNLLRRSANIRLWPLAKLRIPSELFVQARLPHPRTEAEPTCELPLLPTRPFGWLFPRPRILPGPPVEPLLVLCLPLYVQRPSSLSQPPILSGKPACSPFLSRSLLLGPPPPISNNPPVPLSVALLQPRAPRSTDPQDPEPFPAPASRRPSSDVLLPPLTPPPG